MIGPLKGEWQSGSMRAGYCLPVTSAHVVAAAERPPIHRDPFGRIRLAQAATEGFTLLTADAAVARYPCPVQPV